MKEKLRNLLDKTYTPYSKFPVAAIAEMNDGTLFSGVNIENASYGATMCAERVAVFKAVSEGYSKGDFKKLHLISNTGKEIFPCFSCRQVMSEFFKGDEVLVNYFGEETRSYEIDTLLPFKFTSEDL